MAAPFDAGDDQAGRERKIRAAMTWLHTAMAEKPQPAADMIAQAEAAGIARSTLTTARQRLKIRSERRADGWQWIPPRTRKKHPVPV